MGGAGSSVRKEPSLLGEDRLGIWHRLALRLRAILRGGRKRVEAPEHYLGVCIVDAECNRYPNRCLVSEATSKVLQKCLCVFAVQIKVPPMAFCSPKHSWGGWVGCVGHFWYLDPFDHYLDGLTR